MEAEPRENTQTSLQVTMWLAQCDNCSKPVVKADMPGEGSGWRHMETQKVECE